ncbi:MAG: insulinase family protein [Deltaproteobacteria bacterium]|nr:insulinase family protein [Deltaproteobacteria bacterium]
MSFARLSPVVAFTLAALTACGADVPPPKPPTPPVTPINGPPLGHPPDPVPAETPDAPFRQQAPAPDGTVKFVAPKVTETKLKNGLRVLIAERHEVPVVAVRLVVAVGAGDVPDARPGVASFMGAMLEQGTKKRNALQLSDDWEAIGAAHGSWFDWDSGGVSMKVLTEKLDAGLELLSDVALNASFPDAEIERLKGRRIAAIVSEKNSPGVAAQNNVAAALFGRGHPYGHSMSGEEADAKKITRAEVERLYQRMFVLANSAIVVAGDVTPATIVPKLEASFGGWKPAGGPISKKGPKTPAKADTPKRIVLINRPGAQSQIQVVRPGAPFSTKDRDSIIVMNAILGGMFSSRVNLNLREKNAYTYGARSYFAMRHGAGPFLVGASVVADKTVPALKEIFTELEGLKKDGPTAEEMALAKESIRLAMPGRFETVSEVASAISDLIVYDLPLDEYEKRPARIEAITAADVKRVASEWLDAKAMTVVVVGDKAKLTSELDTLGLGAFEERDAYGNPVTPGKPAAMDPKKPEAPKKP